MTMTLEGRATRETIADSWPARIAGLVLLAAIVVIHLADVGDKFEETPYLGVGYVLLICGCVAAAVLLLQTDGRSHQRGWMLAGGLAGLTLLGFVLTRTVGLPQATGDKGEWSEPLGVWSMVTEGLLVLLATACLASRRRSEPALV